MTGTRRGLLGTAVAAAPLPPTRVRAQQPTVTIGALTDMSGPYRDRCPLPARGRRLMRLRNPVRLLRCGPSLPTIRTRPSVRESPVFDKDGVDMIVGADSSAVGLAVQTIVREKNKVLIAQPTTSAITGEQCSPNCVQWHFDTYMFARSTGGATVAAGGDSRFF